MEASLYIFVYTYAEDIPRFHGNPFCHVDTFLYIEVTRNE